MGLMTKPSSKSIDVAEQHPAQVFVDTVVMQHPQAEPTIVAQQWVQGTRENLHTSQRVAGTLVPSGCRAAAALHQTTRLSISCQLCGEAKGPAMLASSSLSSMALASLHQSVNVQHRYEGCLYSFWFCTVTQVTKPTQHEQLERQLNRTRHLM